MTIPTAIRLLLLAVPTVALLTPFSFTFPFIVPRAAAFRILVLLATALLLVLAYRGAVRLRWRDDPAFLALLALIVVGAVSALLGDAPWQSIYGDLERMGGLISAAVLLAYYVLLRSFFLEEDHWRWYFRITVGVAVVAAAVAMVQFAGAGRGAVAGPMGNPGYLGVYLLFHLGFASAALLRYGGRDRIFFAAALLPMAIGLILSQNRSSLLGLVCGAVAAAILLAAHGSARFRRLALPLAALPLLLLAFPLANRMTPEVELHQRLPGVLGKMARAGVTEDGLVGSRLAAWRAGADAFAERPLTGFGPETYHLIWSRHGAPTRRWDRAHNQYLDVLATTGIVGGLAYLLLWGAALMLLFRAIRSRTLEPPEGAVWLALLTGWAVYLFFWFEDVNSVVLWMATLAFLAGRGTGAPLLSFGRREIGSTEPGPTEPGPTEPGPTEKRGLRRPLALAGIVAVALSLYLHAFETLRVSYLLHRAAAPAAHSTLADVTADFRSVFRSPAPQTRIALEDYLRMVEQISPRFPEFRDDERAAAAMDLSFREAFHFLELMQRREPRNNELFLNEAVLRLVALRFYLDPELYESALAAAHHGAELAPRRLPPRYVLAEVYTVGSLYDRAMAQIDTALQVGGERGATRYHQARVHDAQGDPAAAGAALRLAAEDGYTAGGSLTRSILDALDERGDHGQAAALGRSYLEAVREDWFLDDDTRMEGDTLQSAEREIAGRLPLTALRAGDTLLALGAAAGLARADSVYREPVARFLAEVRAGEGGWWAEAPAGTTLWERATGASPPGEGRPAAPSR